MYATLAGACSLAAVINDVTNPNNSPTAGNAQFTYVSNISNFVLKSRAVQGGALHHLLLLAGGKHPSQRPVDLNSIAGGSNFYLIAPLNANFWWILAQRSLLPLSPFPDD